MLLTYQHRVFPEAEQDSLMRHHLELLRRHWNYALGQRFDWLSRTRCQLDRCSLHSCPIGEIPGRLNYYTQQAALPETKRLFPEYLNIWAEAQQINLRRLDEAWTRWLIPDATGKRGGRPRFKKPGQLRSFTYPRINCPKAGATLKEGKLTLSKIGEMAVVIHRPIPNGFKLKQCTLVLKADGWYACLSMQDDTVPTPMAIDQVKAAVGIDVGLEKFLTTSDAQVVPIQQHYRRSQHHLARAQRKLSHQIRNSKRFNQQASKVAQLQLHVARQRREFHYQVAHWLIGKYDLIGVEHLNIRGLARTRLGKSILDAAWGQFITILQAVAVKRGKYVVNINPSGTSQNCSHCGARVPKTLAERVHACGHCGYLTDRDHNSAINVLRLALESIGQSIPGCEGLVSRPPLKQQLSVVRLGSSCLIAS